MRGSEERTERRQPAGVGTEFEVALAVRTKVIVTGHVVELDISTGYLDREDVGAPMGSQRRDRKCRHGPSLHHS